MTPNIIQQIWILQFLEVVRRHILGVVDNVIRDFWDTYTVYIEEGKRVFLRKLNVSALQKYCCSVFKTVISVDVPSKMVVSWRAQF